MNHQRKLTKTKSYLLALLLCFSAMPILHAQCFFEVSSIQATDCGNSLQFNVILDMDWGGGSDSFTVAGNGNNYGTFAKADLPVTLMSPFFQGNGTTIFEFVIRDQVIPGDCFTVAVLGPILCGPAEDCSIENISYALTPCNNDGYFTATINFDWEYTSQSFTIVGNGVNYGTFSYSEVPVTLGPLPGNGTAYEFGVFDSENQDCGGWVETDEISCPPFEDCDILVLHVETGDCNPSGVFLLWIDFEVENPGNDFFDVYLNGQFVGFFPLSQLPVSIPAGPGGGLVQVCINDNPDCCAFMQFENPCNNSGCEIWDANATATDCNDQGLFNVILNFEHNNNTSDSFSVSGGGLFYGHFAYADLPVFINGLQGNGSIYEFVVHDLEHPDCSDFAILESENCSGLCDIYELHVETGDCNPNGVFPLWIDFEVNNPGNNFFDVFINGQFVGFFPLSALPVSVQAGPGNGVVKVCINDNPDCCAIKEFQSPCNSDCEILEVIAETTPCNDQGFFDVLLFLEYSNTSDSFSVVGNGINYGHFAYADLPILFSGLAGNGSTYEFGVHDLEHPDCGGFDFFVSENCMDLCEIHDLQVETGDCNPNGVYPIWINFEVENPTGNSFDIFINGQFAGFFPLSALPVSVQAGPGNGVVTVCINDNPDCCATKEFDSPCSNSGCEIWNVVTEVTDCNDQGLFNVFLNFNYNNTSDSFFVVGNGNSYGHFAYADLPILITGLPGNGMTYEFVVIDLEHPDCSDFAIVESENCLGLCHIYDLHVETGDCNPNGVFPLWINFEVDNPTANSFDVFIDGQFVGFFPLSALPVSVQAGPGNGVVKVCINDNPDCCATKEFESPCNNGDCDITDFILEAWDCDSDGNFLVDLDFNVTNPQSDSFQLVVYTNAGISVQNFAYSDLYITVGPFVADGSQLVFVVSDLDNPECSSVNTLLSEDCNGGDCSISELDVYPLDCNPDGTYAVLILFDYENVNSDFFDAYAGGNYIGSFLYADLPLTIPAFPASGNDFDVLTICDSGNTQCCTTEEFPALDCESCNIEEVLLSPSDCNNLNQFNVHLDLEVTGGGSLGFMVLGNGVNYGIFDYADLPITLGPFDGDGVSVYEFIVVDVADTDCVGFATIGPIQCQVPPPVWPGDINEDNISNHYDLLHMGIAFGASGSARNDESIEWNSFEALNWAGAFADGTNYKHADCNGDGEVNNADLSAIEQNYDLVHGDVIAIEQSPIVTGSPLFYIDLPTFDEITMGQAFVAPIILGDVDVPVDHIYGIAFTVEYDPDMMDEAGVYVETGSSWLGEQGSQLISINRSFADQGKIEVSITRTDHNNTSGFGTISYFIGIIDDIAGKTELTINISNVVAITYDEQRISLDTPPSVIDLITSVAELVEPSVLIYPNPAQHLLTIKTEYSATPERISIYNTLGQLIWESQQPMALEEVAVDNWSSGIYFVDVQFADGKVSERVEVVK